MSVYFYAFTIKTDFENVLENGRFRLKNRAKSSQSSHFTIFLKIKTAIIIEKRKTLINFLL